jgi:hypothetical protein
LLDLRLRAAQKLWTKGAVTLMRQTYRMVRGAGYSRWQAFCAAVFDIEPPDPYEKIIAKTYASLPDPDENKAELNASRDRLIELDSALAKSHILPDLIAEWHALPLFADYEVRDACLTRIRKIDPELAERLSLRRHAEMQDAANDPGG